MLHEVQHFSMKKSTKVKLIIFKINLFIHYIKKRIHFMVLTNKMK